MMKSVIPFLKEIVFNKKEKKKNFKRKNKQIPLSSITFKRLRNYRQIKRATVNNLYSSYSWSELCVLSVKLSKTFRGLIYG
jgi:hypothetical protein